MATVNVSGSIFANHLFVVGTLHLDLVLDVFQLGVDLLDNLDRVTSPVGDRSGCRPSANH